MSRILKLIGIVVVAVIVLFVAALIAVGMLFDPNDYKDDITAAVERATGRQLTLDGRLELAVFPSVRIALGSATLSNARGFGNEPMAKIKSAQLSVSLLPLLSRRIEIGQARLEGLELNLARDARGRNNWQDLGGGQAAGGATPAAGGSGANLNLGVEAIEVTDARVNWTDAASGSRWELTNFGLTAQGFGPGKKFPLEMRFGLSGKDVTVAVDANMQATLSLADNQYRLDGLDVHIDGRGAAWPGGSGSADLGFESLIAKLNDETLELDGLKLDMLGVTTTGSLSGQKLLSDLSLTGAVDIHQFDPRAVLKVFGVDIKTADDGVLKRASAKANLLYSSSQIGLRDMQLALDDSKLTGRVGLAGDALSYDLNVDDIDVDRYLPPATDAPAADEGSLDAVDLPLDVLRTLNAKGDLKFKKAKFSGLTLTDTTFSLAAAGGRIELKPTAALYGGRLAGSVVLQVQQNAARMTVDQQLTKVNLAPLGHDLIESDAFAGTGDVRLNVGSTGSNLGEMRRKLDGDISLSVVDGALEGIDFWYELRRARATIDKTPVPARPAGTPRTPFSSLTASGVVKDAVLTNRDLNANLGFMSIDGKGTVNLLTNAVQFDLIAMLTDGEQLQSDPAMAKMAGGSLPLKVTGTLDAPSVLPDFGALVRAKARAAVSESVEEKKQEVQDKLKDKLKGLLNR